MPHYYTQLWKNDTWEKMSERLSNYLDGRLARSSSNAFEKMGVKPGDHVYVITDKKGSLILGGKIIVDKVLNQDEAQKYEDWGYCLPEWGKHIVMPLREAGLFTPKNKVPINIVKKLWFISGRKPIQSEDLKNQHGNRTTGDFEKSRLGDWGYGSHLSNQEQGYIN